MVQPAIPVPPQPWTFGAAMGNVQPPSRRPAILKEIAVAVVDVDLRTKIDAAIEAFGFVQPPPVERLQAYAQFDDARWQELMLKLPEKGAEMWSDYMRLLERARNGDFS